MATFTTEEQRAYVKIETARGTNARGIHSALQEACGEDALSYRTVADWAKRFREGRTAITDDPRSGRPISSSDEIHVRQVDDLLQEDRRYTCAEIAETLGISQSTVHYILTNKLGKRKISARWVPHNLSPDQLQYRVSVARQLLARHRREGNNFLHRIVAIDETWLRSYEPELKRQSAEWRDPGSPRPKKFRQQQGQLKQMCICAYDYQGVLVADRVPLHQSVNKEYYRAFIQGKLRPAIRRKRPELLESSPVILQDNASCHSAHIVAELLETYDWEVLPHPAYSPDMSPPDYDLFPILKEALRGRRFHSLEELNHAVDDRLREINRNRLCQGIMKLPHRWAAVVELSGDYIEG